MARKKVREYDAKRLLKSAFHRLAGVSLPINVVQVNEGITLHSLLQNNSWLADTKLVVKPDMLFGQRGKNDLVGLNLGLEEAQQFIEARMNRVVTINGCTAPITTFLVEPFVPHDTEYYLCIQSTREGFDVSFSEAGGIHVEENWDKLQTVSVKSLEPVDGGKVAPLITGLPLEIRPKMEAYLLTCINAFDDLDMSLLEMNPFTVDKDGNPFPLDARMELDDTSKYRNNAKWGDVEFPLPFGRVLSDAEDFIHGLDEQTGASLKFTVLNPHGRIWPMVAGGGASVIYADTVADLGYAHELGNYGEYSGAPNTEETYSYARTVLDCVTKHLDGRPKALLIGGGIANFTDVAATFKGIIQALREKSVALKAANVHVFVRRGGPNYEKGLDMMRQLGEELGIPMHVCGPESSMTCICKMAIDCIAASA